MSAPDTTETLPGGASTEPQPPASAPAPLAPGGSQYIGVLGALLLIGLGAVGIHDGIAAAGWIDAPSWTGAAVTWFDGLVAADWMVPVGIVVAVVGLILIGLALAPRRSRAIPVRAATSVYLDIADSAALATAAARDVPGVTKAHATATRRAVKVAARVTGPDVTDEVIADAVRHALHRLDANQKVSVRTRIESL